MEEINNTGFKGVEICTIFPEEKDLQIVKRIKKEFIKSILGNRDGLTIVGPASIIKEIRRDPNKIMLYTVVPSEFKRKSSTRKIRRTSRKASTSSRKRRR